jgi:ribose-phosphate pyrophosphokinase
MSRLQVIAGSSYLAVGRKVARYLNLNLTPVHYSTFADGEKYVRVKQKVRGDDIFIIQSVSPPVNDNLMELLICIDALKRASAGRINVVAPYLGYSRQDRKVTSREPITAKLVANLITVAGANRIFSVDLHQDQIQGFYDIPVDHFVGYPIFAEYFQKKRLNGDKIVIVVRQERW